MGLNGFETQHLYSSHSNLLLCLKLVKIQTKKPDPTPKLRNLKKLIKQIVNFQQNAPHPINLKYLKYTNIINN